MTLKKYDIIFWAHGHNEIERYLPIMAGLKKADIRCLLFYQDYSFKDDISLLQQRIINHCALDITDYSCFLDNNLILRLVNSSARLPLPRFIKNKMKGIRSKLLKNKVNNTDFIRKLLLSLNHKLNVFDLISLADFVEYPIGSYYIKKASDDLNIKSLALPHGGTVCKFKEPSSERKNNFSHMIAPNNYEKELLFLKCTDKNAEIAALGDCRFDTGWKNQLKVFYNGHINNFLKKNMLNIAYICPNLSGFGFKNVNLKDTEDVIGVLKRLGEVNLLIKPHPRCKFDDKIKRILKKHNFKNYIFLGDIPLISYIDSVDMVISTLTSAINDALPEYPEKVVIYDNFSQDRGLSNIYESVINCFNNPNDLYNFISHPLTLKSGHDKEARIREFCNEWIGGGQPLDKIVSNYCNYILRLFQRKGKV